MREKILLYAVVSMSLIGCSDHIAVSNWGDEISIYKDGSARWHYYPCEWEEIDQMSIALTCDIGKGQLERHELRVSQDDNDSAIFGQSYYEKTLYRSN